MAGEGAANNRLPSHEGSGLKSLVVFACGSHPSLPSHEGSGLKSDVAVLAAVADASPLA